MFISGRFVMNGVYIYEYHEKDEYIAILSSKGNEELLA